jgi:hypothetical protein
MNMKPEPRILILSQRGYNSKVWMTMPYEFEDVISAIDDAEIISPTLRAQSRVAGFVRRQYDEARSSLGLYREANIDSIRLDRDYEMFFCVIAFPGQLPLLKKMRNLRQRCRRAVCFLTEFWSHELAQEKRNLSILEDLQFDFVFFPHPTPLPVLKDFLGGRCQFLPCGVDCVRFSPYPKPPRRSIDCLSIGRRPPMTHQGLLQLAERGDFHYIYDTARDFNVAYHQEHRRLIANWIKRSRYFIAYKPSVDRKAEGRDEIIASRFFEGPAGGAVILGSAPACKEFQELFDSPDAVIPIPFNCANIGDIIAELDSQPQRLAAASHNNIVNCLARHDWVYRWEHILKALDMKPGAALTERLARLQQLRQLAMVSTDKTATAAGTVR